MKIKIPIIKKHRIPIIYLSMMMLVGLFSQINAQSILTESFNYTSGTNLTSSGWTAATSVAPNITIVNGNLSYPNTIGDTSGNKILLNSTGQTVEKTLDYYYLNATTPNIYSSMVVNVNSASATGDYFYAMAVGTSSVYQNSRIYIKSNGSGFSFGVGKTESAAQYETTVRQFGTNYFLVLKYEFVTGNNNDHVKLYVNANTTTEPVTPDIITTPNVADATYVHYAYLHQRGNSLEVDGINMGRSWNNVVGPVFDYGDTPTSYDTSKDGVFIPAAHELLPNFHLGRIAPDLELYPNNVSNGEDNNGTNGDGMDEDAIDGSTIEIRKSVPFSLTFPVRNTSGTKYLYGWIDFNNNGKFEANEATTTSFSTTGESRVTLTWTNVQTNNIPDDITKLYMRIRLSNVTLNDFTSGTNATLLDERSIGSGAISSSNSSDHSQIVYGEVEDYQINAVKTFDYGDLPSTFENNISGVSTPAVHAPFTGFSIGKLIDLETEPASVTSPNENNTTGDNAVGIADEDGITNFEGVNRGVIYSITVPLSIPTALGTGAKYIYAWLDLNGDGRFQANEGKSTYAYSGTSLTLSWTAAETNLIPVGTKKIYLRLRFSDISLTDFTSGTNAALIDERSIGNGAISSNNSANALRTPYGEVEDYQLPVDFYDFGDVPASYELNNANISFPARQIGKQTDRIGRLIDTEENPSNVAANADNNGTNGDGEDEDGLITLPIVRKGVGFSFSVPVTVSASSSIIAWVDFNNDGKFQANEASYTTATGTTTGYRTAPTGNSTATFWFKGIQTANIPDGVTNLYARIRLTRTAGSDNTSTTNIDERSIGDANTSGTHITPLIGEVEDYRFVVGENLFDFGDVPQSYEINRNGLNRPARNYPTDFLYLGNSFDYEANPQSVAIGADNNGTNGDGEDEDGISTDQLTIKAGVAKSFTVAVNNSTDAAASLYAWIDFNNNGRFEAGEASTVVSVPVDATTATVSFTAAQIGSSVTNNPYMRLRYLQAESGTTIGDFTSGTNATLLDERSIADGLNTGEYGAISAGEIEDYQLTIVRDYGDVPASYENGAPASHTNTNPPELYMGDTIDFEIAPNSVEIGADNNGTNGDGEDEDAVKTAEVITTGVAYTLTIPVNTTVTGTKYLYAWIDFNGNGRFDGNEAATASASVTAGTTSNFTLNWNTVGFATSILEAKKVYVRFRLSTTSLSNSNGPTLIDTRSYGQNNSSGEIEDYQFIVNNNFDHGDVPASYETSSTGTGLPARNAVSPKLRLGELVEAEEFPNSVTPGADNNGANGDGLEEDGVKRVIPIYKNNMYYVRVKVLNNTGSSKLFIGWLDINNDGRFEIYNGESNYVYVPSSPLMQEITLRFPTTNIATNLENVYMRLRISNSFFEWANSPFDGRSIGDGTTYLTPTYTTPQIGEVEDYRVAITKGSFDYGDLPDSYDMSRNDVLSPARQAASAGLFIGDEPADEELTKRTSENAEGDNGDFVDDEINFIKNPVFANRPYTIQVPVTKHTVGGTLYGWIDFNQNGRFEASEVATASTYSGYNKYKYKLTWTVAQVNNIVGDPENLALRLRVSEGTLTDFTTGAAGALVDERALADGLNTGEYAAVPIVTNGEVEDHMIKFSSNSDFGDAPESYEFNNSNVKLPARNFANEDLVIGRTIDIEPTAQNVAPGADSNGTNGDGEDEDGIVGTIPNLVSGAGYSVDVNVINHTGTAGTLRGWIDMDGNGRFTANEQVSVAVPSLPFPTVPEQPIDPENPPIDPPEPQPITQKVTLTWPFINYTGTADRTYLRLRLTNVTQTDNTSTPNIDERSIADGLSSGIYGISSGSTLYPYDVEIEDYSISTRANPVELVPCDPSDINRVGVVDPVQSLYHGNIFKTENDWLVFGASANGNGTNQNTPIKVISGSNGFNFEGTPLIVTGASNAGSGHQYILLSSAGLYAFGSNNFIFSKAAGMQQIPLPPNTAPSDVKIIDAGASISAPYSLALLTKTGGVWIYSNTSGSAVQGDGNLTGIRWHQVMLNATTPLTGITDIKSAGASVMAMDGENVYTWGRNVFLGNGTNVTTRNFATKMTLPPNITTPILQQDLSNSTATSYYLRDSAGDVFVLGANQSGQLGIGSTANTSSWLSINEVNEESADAGNEADETKNIPSVVWISANNHDSNFPIFSLITDEGRAYTTGSNDGGKAGVVGATAVVSSNIIVPTAVTSNSGSEPLKGKVRFIEAGGHLSILIKERSNRYGYTGHTGEGSDGCSGCTSNSTEFNFNRALSTATICGNFPSYDYGDLDERYNLGGEENMARHEIKFSEIENPLKLGALAPDSEDGPQFTETGSANNANGDDTDAFGDDEDAFTQALPTKIAGSPYSLQVPLTNNTGSTAYLYGFIDWNDNGVFDPNETTVVEVQPSETQQTVTISWPNNPSICSNELDAIRSFVRLRLTTQLLEDIPGTPQDERSFLSAEDGEVEDYFLDWIKGACEVLCYRAAVTIGESILDTNVGISSITRAINSTDNWPTVRKGAWLAMESKTKGFVLNRIPFNNLNQPIGINPTNYVEGMTIYDTTNKCMKIYTSQDNGTTFGWYCMTNQACPN